MIPSPLSAASWATLLIAFFFALAAGPRVIVALGVLKFGQNINTDAPEGHRKKQGTPTMGGVLMVIGVLAALVCAQIFPSVRRLSAIPLAIVVLVFLAHAGLGFLDDYLKIKRGRSLGLRARDKIVGQVIIAGLFLGWVAFTARPGYTTALFLFGAHVDLGYFYYVVAAILMIGMSNATNLSDGLDGLAGGLAVITTGGLALLLQSPALGLNAASVGQMPLFLFALIGACLGFLWYNAYPARVFMGDTGSLALGSALAAVAIIGKIECLLLVYGLVFVAEAVSVAIQVIVFKATGGKPNGRRVFKMAPIHHHFELLGWPETQVVLRFWIAGLLCVAAGSMIARWFEPRVYLR